MYKVVDMFTTRDGSWTPNGELYSITPEMASKYGADAKELGGATQIFVKLIGGPGSQIRFFTVAGFVETHPAKENGWANCSMANPGSGYNPNNNTGPWSVMADTQPSEIVSGIGLPFGWHVSTFIVYEWVEDGDPDTGEGPTEPTEPTDPAEPEAPNNIWVVVSSGKFRYQGYLEKAN